MKPMISSHSRNGLAAGLFGALATLTVQAEFRPGEVWPDTAGNHIQAHGGGVLARGGVYFWYGEDRTLGGRGAVACYSSTNLVDWKREGVVLAREALPRVEERSTFVERPKVIFNPHSGKFVMWMHLEQRGYRFARAGVAVSDGPAGPFVFLKFLRPVTNDFNFPEDDNNRQKQLGGTFRDMNLFLDDDGRAYVFYAAEDNFTMYVVRLNDKFTGPAQPMEQDETWARILVRGHREAPAPFKHQGRYYLITSGCTGWKPNAADYAVAENILGPWKMKGNPCTGPEAELTFRAQSTSVLAVPGKPGHFIFMADRWNPQNLPDSRYVWLPFTIPWRERWSLADLARE